MGLGISNRSWRLTPLSEWRASASGKTSTRRKGKRPYRQLGWIHAFLKWAVEIHTQEALLSKRQNPFALRFYSNFSLFPFQ